MSHDRTPDMPVTQERAHASLKGPWVEVSANYVVELLGVEVQRLEEISEAKRARAFIRAGKAKAMGRAALRHPQEELPRESLSVPVSFVEVHDQLESDVDSGEGALHVVREEEPPYAVNNLSHGH